MQIVISFSMNDFIYWITDQLDLSMVEVNVLAIHKNI